MTNTILRTSAVAAAAALLVLGAGRVVADPAAEPPAQASAAAPAPVQTVAAAQGASRAVGALFAGGKHFCSASVLHSAAGDVVLTAAHCAGGSGLSFAPGYHDGIAPYGMWAVSSVRVAAGWKSSADPDLDFAFLTVHQAGNPSSVESLVGADNLGINRGFTNQITLTGYPDDTNSPVVCAGSTTQSDTYQQRVACPGFPDGTSGGPWVTDVNPLTGDGTVIGVIGGYEQGGDTPDVSYSAYFDDDIQDLYNSVRG